MDLTNVAQSDSSVVDTVVDESIIDEASIEVAEEIKGDSTVDQLNNSTTPTEEEVALLERVCEAARQPGKELSKNEKLHITNSTVSFSSNCRMRTSGKKSKSWELNYPALAFLLNGGYYADYAGIMGTMGFLTMHHSKSCVLLTNPCREVGRVVL